MFVQQFTEKTGHNFDQYYKKYKPKLVRFLIGIGKDEDDAEDVATEAFVTSLNKIDSYDPTKAVFSTWLFTIAKRIMIQKAREKSKFTSIDVDYDDGFSIGETLSYDDTDYETGHAINYQKSKSIKNIIPELPEKYATVLTLRHISNDSYQEIAEKLGILVIQVPATEIAKIKHIKQFISYDKFKNATRMCSEKQDDRKYELKLIFKYDAVNKGFIFLDGAKVKNFEELLDDLKRMLKVDNITIKALNLNTVKSRIRQARLLLYRLTKDDFQKLDNLDKDNLDINDVYDNAEELEYNEG